MNIYLLSNKNGPKFSKTRRKVQRKLFIFCLAVLLVIIVLYFACFFFMIEFYERRNLLKGTNSDPIAEILYKDEMNPKDKNNIRYDILSNLKWRMKRSSDYEDFYNRLKNGDDNGEVTIKCIPTNITESDADLFPDDLFTQEERIHGAILFHIFGLFFMFTALAITCDEFFVPALGIISENLNISNNVAGATLMAAGGSAPEFFTSLFGVFIGTNVGIGTIVGSATFNILCVLAFCTLFSKEVLQLTWWPLYRDISFYITSLVLLGIFFIDEMIECHEAFILFFIYILYIIFMKYNESIEFWTKKNFFPESFKVMHVGDNEFEDDVFYSDFEKRKRNSFQVAKVKSSGAGNVHEHLVGLGTLGIEALPSEPVTIPVLHSGAFFRQSLAQMALDNSMEETPRSEDHHSRMTPKKGHRDSVSTPRNGKSQINIIQVLPAPENATVQNGTANNKFYPPSIKKVNGVSCIKTGQTKKSLTPSGNKHVEIIISPSSQTSVSQPNEEATSSNEEAPEKPLDLSWPQTCEKQLIYIFLMPITYCLYFTLPDVRRHGFKKFAFITFVGSIIWIAIFSYIMVFLANTIGVTFGISTEIMGLTILAAGTSIPDLITSVIVARKGLGDMAVSSSIGSNLFDVSIGIGIPHLIWYLVDYIKKYSAQNGKDIVLSKISVSSNGLICSVGMLILMLAVLIISIAISKWQMNKLFGVIMIISYLGFCIFSVLLEINVVTCPLKLTNVGSC